MQWWWWRGGVIGVPGAGVTAGWVVEVAGRVEMEVRW